MLQVVLRCPTNGEPLAVALPADVRHQDLPAPSQIVASEAPRCVHHFFCRASRHDLSTVDAGARPYVNEVVRRPHGVLIVFHHNEGVAQVAEVFQGGKQQVIVPLVQADRRLVQDIQHSHEGGANLGGQPDTLALAAGQSARLPAQG